MSPFCCSPEHEEFALALQHSSAQVGGESGAVEWPHNLKEKKYVAERNGVDKNLDNIISCIVFLRKVRQCFNPQRMIRVPTATDEYEAPGSEDERVFFTRLDDFGIVAN